MWEKLLKVGQDLVSTRQRLGRLEQGVADLNYELRDIDARLIRVETIVEMSGGGRPQPRPRRLGPPE